MGIVVIGSTFVDIKGYPMGQYIPDGRNAGSIENVHGGVARNVVENIANIELRPSFVSLVDDNGAGLDVIEQEPISVDNPLNDFKDSNRLIITPHLGWASTEARQRCVDFAYDNVKAFLEGRPQNLV